MSNDPGYGPVGLVRRAWRTDQEWGRLRERLDGDEIVAEPARWLAPRARWLAAAAVILGVGSALTWRLTRPEPSVERVATTAAGERIVIHLADSSLVTLGPASRRFASSRRRRRVTWSSLVSPTSRSCTTRVVPLWFARANAIATEVGTEFVVRAYASDSTVQVSVTSGSVDLASSAGRPAIRLQAGDVGARGGKRKHRSSRAIAARAFGAATLRGSMVDSCSTRRAAGRMSRAELSRWFDVDIQLADPTLARRAVSAVYNRPTLDGVLDALSATLGVRSERTGRTIVIRPRSP